MINTPFRLLKLESGVGIMLHKEINAWTISFHRPDEGSFTIRSLITSRGSHPSRELRKALTDIPDWCGDGHEIILLLEEKGWWEDA